MEKEREEETLMSRCVPVKQAVRQLRRAGFDELPAQGKHRKFRHPRTQVILSLPRSPQGDVLWGFLAQRVRRLTAGR
ncbi:MAG: hypothetical protein A2148_08625 [Chloroflexi bacterium RBG_16_68_14]|nr:MAG: hypothetical protein A2148_08625 [Chloroflexi bacterium RBG_16_68_14]